ncbi:hypothetical protein ACQKMV_05340 [Lysinibacillus sp. NPDC094403]|uniref:hypothetical protein n=1 Tax=Lysinibacillus sp. NPDC094403 TaxID=3390581 RepID=UPI003CFCF2D1
MNKNLIIKRLYDLLENNYPTGFFSPIFSLDENSKEKINDIINGIESINTNKLILNYIKEESNIVEVALPYSNRIILQDDGESLNLFDDENEINYTVGISSDFYVVWLFIELFKRYDNSSKVISTLQNRVRTYKYKRNLVTGNSNITIDCLDLMKSIINLQTIKISSSNVLMDTSKLTIMLDSFAYTYMCNKGRETKVYSIEEIVGINSSRKERKTREFEAPKRIYNSELIEYYNLAISSDDPFISFISYYHILEYFYDEIFKEFQIDNFKKSITSPTFSTKDNNQMYKIIKKIIKDGKEIKENGSGNEQKSLNFVLNKFINDIEDFKNKLSETEIEYYSEKKVPFSAGDIIDFNSKDTFIKNISNRIYKTRNALIHRKSGEQYKDLTYNPYMHKTELRKEISLIKTIAEMVIENSSSYIDF